MFDILGHEINCDLGNVGYTSLAEKAMMKFLFKYLSDGTGWDTKFSKLMKCYNFSFITFLNCPIIQMNNNYHHVFIGY